MAVNRIALIGLSVLGLIATITTALAQNTSNPMTSGNTTNPILSGNTVTQPPPSSCFSGPSYHDTHPDNRKKFVYWTALLGGRRGDSTAAFDFRLNAIAIVAKRLRLIAVVLNCPLHRCRDYVELIARAVHHWRLACGGEGCGVIGAVPGTQTGSTGGAKDVAGKDAAGDAKACAGELVFLRDGVRVDPVPRILASAFAGEVFGSGFIMPIAGIDAALGKSASTTAFL
jgi:hypothetical protein